MAESAFRICSFSLSLDKIIVLPLFYILVSTCREPKTYWYTSKKHYYFASFSIWDNLEFPVLGVQALISKFARVWTLQTLTHSPPVTSNFLSGKEYCFVKSPVKVSFVVSFVSLKSYSRRFICCSFLETLESEADSFPETTFCSLRDRLSTRKFICIPLWWVR